MKLEAIEIPFHKERKTDETEKNSFVSTVYVYTSINGETETETESESESEAANRKEPQFAAASPASPLSPQSSPAATVP